MGPKRYAVRTTAAVAALVLTAIPAASCSSASKSSPSSSRADRSSNPYSTAPFTVHQNSYTFGQDPSWTADGRVVSNEDDQSGTAQIYVSKLDGAAIKCLTCGQPGPNGFPQERPQGDWILFCSWRGQTVTLGKPCLGGYGSDMYAMRPDGSHVTRLTMPGSSFEPPGVLYDNYHPAWSPDGTQLVWTHVSFDTIANGGTQWTMLVADFAQHGDRAPSLENVVVVGPGGNTGYETQPWAPDGSGFLYTLFTAPDKATGWLNTELYFMRLHGGGASLAHPKSTHLTDNHPGWDEQAVFTPDMKDVIFMSSRAAPTWYQTVVTAAQQTGFLPPMQNEVVGTMFFEAISDPGFHTDLYDLDLSTHSIRRLTFLDSVVPEFYFGRSGKQILWSEGSGKKRTMIGTFALPSSPTKVGPNVAPAAAWVGAPRGGPVSRPAPRSAAPSTANPNGGALPAVILEGGALFLTQLATLTQQLSGLTKGPSCCRAPAG